MKLMIIVVTAIGPAVMAAIGHTFAQTPVPREDCAPYVASQLRLEDEGDRGWLISRGDGARFMVLDTKQDADVMMGVFRAHTAFCYVGRDNRRGPKRDRYVYHYWK